MEMDSILQMSAGKNAKTLKIYEDVWSKRIGDFIVDLGEFSRRALFRPTVCFMGRRGAGKTTLIRNWLGKSRIWDGIFELNRLPTGGKDTTAALVRLIPAYSSIFDKNYLYVNLLKDGELDVDNKPPRPYNIGIDFSLSKKVDAGDFEDPYRSRANVRIEDIPYNVCRFPDEMKDGPYSLKGNGDIYRIVANGEGASLTSVQWYAWQVAMPVDVDRETGGWAGRVLSVADAVDAPGADPSEQGKYSEWKGKKMLLFLKEE